MPDPTAPVNPSIDPNAPMPRRPEHGRMIHAAWINQQRRTGAISPYAGPTVTVQDRGMMPTGGRGVPDESRTTMIFAWLTRIHVTATDQHPQASPVTTAAALNAFLTEVERALVSPNSAHSASLLRAIARHRAVTQPIPDPDRDEA